MPWEPFLERVVQPMSQSEQRKKERQNATGREGKFEACIPGNHGKQEFPLTPAMAAPSIDYDHIKIKLSNTVKIKFPKNMTCIAT